MSRYKAGLTVTTSEHLEGLFDLDFTENTEYYREDTLSLGYENEAERVIAENTKDGKIDIDSIIKIAYRGYDDYNYDTFCSYNEKGENIIIISVSFIE